MPQTITVSGQLTVADDGTVSGTLTVSGSTEPGAGTPDVITDGGGAPLVTDPPAGDLPPYAPDVPAGEAPSNPVDPAPGDPGVADTGPVPDGLGVDQVPVDTGADAGEAEADPTTAGAEAGADTGSTAESTPAGPPYPGHDLSRDDHQHKSDPDVRAWQQAAKDAGYTVGKVDGFFGPKTESGVIEAQQAALVPTTGVIDAATWALPFNPAG